VNATLKVKVSYKLFHHSSGGGFAELRAKVSQETGGNPRVKLAAVKLDEEALRAATKGGAVHDWTLANFRKLVRAAVLRLANDPDGMLFPYRWDDETCLECAFSYAD